MLEIRNATEKDLDMLTELEHACFHADEAASREMLNDRLASYANHFWLLERDGELVSMVNGMVTDDHDLDDSMYADASQHNERKMADAVWCGNTAEVPQKRLCLHTDEGSY